MFLFILKNLNIMAMFMLNDFLYFIIFLFWSYFFLWKSIIFLPCHGGNLDQYRECINLINSFCLIKCKAYFWASFFFVISSIFCFEAVIGTSVKGSESGLYATSVRNFHPQFASNIFNQYNVFCLQKKLKISSSKFCVTLIFLNTHI